jgi:acetolactate synthase small subunit
MSSVAVSVADRDLLAAACFTVQARAEPGVMPRLIELFAKRGLVPELWRSAKKAGADGAELTIEIRMSGLGHDTIDYIAACMRQVASVRTVLAAETHASAID